MPVYKYVEYDLTNATGCIPVEHYLDSLQYITLKTDAIKLGVYCFIAGMLLVIVIQYLKRRWDLE